MTRVAVLGLAVAVFAAWAAPGAEARPLRSSDGTVFDIACNANGFVLTSRRTAERIFFGASGDTMSPGRGTGDWCMANAGLSARVGNRFFAFPRQEPHCPGQGHVDYGPSCSD